MCKFKKRLLKLNEKLEKRVDQIERKKLKIKQRDSMNMRINLSIVEELNKNVDQFESVISAKRRSAASAKSKMSDATETMLQNLQEKAELERKLIESQQEEDNKPENKNGTI